MNESRFKKPDRRSIMKRVLTYFGIPIMFFIIGIVVGNVAGKLPFAFAAPNTVILSQGSHDYTLDDYTFFIFIRSDKVFAPFVELLIRRSEAESRGLQVTDAEIDKFIAENMKDEKGVDKYKAYSELFDPTVIKRYVRMLILEEKLEDTVRTDIIKEQGIKVTEADAKDYYLKNIDKIFKPALVELSIISTKKREECDAALKRLQAGEDFNDVASQVNENPDIRKMGGYLGPASYKELEQINSILAESAFNLKAGTYSAVIRGESAFHILFVHATAPEYSPSFEEIKSDLMTLMLEDKLNKPLSAAYGKIRERGAKTYNPKAQLFAIKNADDLKTDGE